MVDFIDIEGLGVLKVTPICCVFRVLVYHLARCLLDILDLEGEGHRG